jgi:hypothetical protein
MDDRIEGHLLLRTFRAPDVCAQFDHRQWNFLLGSARETRLLGRLAHILESRDLLSKIPPVAADTVRWAQVHASAQERAIRWEVHQIVLALRGTDVPIVLLKGTAYIMAGLPPARGRVFNDVDIMVPRDSLDRVEEAFLRNGWEHGELDNYDRRYYRHWMHELPPLQHRERKTTLDVHHTILPETGRLHPSTDELFRRAVPIPGTRLMTLHPADMILHSAAHLFQDGAVAGSLRDLFDLHDLLSCFSRQTGFEALLRQRAILHQLTRPLFYALRYCNMYLGTEVSPLPEGPPNAWVTAIMDAAVLRALLPVPSGLAGSAGAISRKFLYLRSHWLRMPAHLLAPHLFRKWLRRWCQEAPAT